jgi:hypothetical protein
MDLMKRFFPSNIAVVWSVSMCDQAGIFVSTYFANTRTVQPILAMF